MRKTLVGLALFQVTFLCGLAGADRGPRMPEPTRLLDAQAVSLGVVHARAEDAGFRSLLKTAWEAMRQRKNKGSSFLDLVSGFLSSTTQENILLGFLPFQAARIDHIDAKGSDKASFMVTVGGWAGVQALFWNTLLQGPDGKPYPTEKVAGETVILRAKPGQPREEASVIARVDGTFYSFANLETARKVLDRQLGENAGLAEVFAELDHQQDTYGVILNRQQSLLRFFNWVNKRDFITVEEAVGSERLRQVLGHVEHVTWQGDLLSDDRMDMQIRFHADAGENAEQIEEVLSLARTALAAKGRTESLEMTTVDQEVLLTVQFTGYRKMLVDYINR